MGVFAFALNAVAQIDTVHCVLAAFCVDVGISGRQEWLDLFGNPFDAYSVQRFWGYVRSSPDVLDLTETLLSRRTWHQLLRRVSFIDAITYLTHTNDRTSQPLKSCTIFVVTEVLHCPRGIAFYRLCLPQHRIFNLRSRPRRGRIHDARQIGFGGIPILHPSRPCCLC